MGLSGTEDRQKLISKGLLSHGFDFVHHNTGILTCNIKKQQNLRFCCFFKKVILYLFLIMPNIPLNPSSGLSPASLLPPKSAEHSAQVKFTPDQVLYFIGEEWRQFRFYITDCSLYRFSRCFGVRFAFSTNSLINSCIFFGIYLAV